MALGARLHDDIQAKRSVPRHREGLARREPNGLLLGMPTAPPAGYSCSCEADDLPDRTPVCVVVRIPRPSATATMAAGALANVRKDLPITRKPAPCSPVNVRLTQLQDGWLNTNSRLAWSGARSADARSRDSSSRSYQQYPDGSAAARQATLPRQRAAPRLVARC